MKLNWGTSIAIIYTVFAATMVGFVIKSRSFDHALVVDDYYAKDLAYQSQYDKLTNSRNLTNDLTISKTGENVQLAFPKEFSRLEGEILFYRADDKSKDFTLKIAPDGQGEQLVPSGTLTPGRWTVKVDWQGDGKAFFKEEVIIL
ncbi:MAG: FixH family protein [Bacteroidetes bacterium]|nr:FixH family protein [Bacteroidota bacterium]